MGAILGLFISIADFRPPMEIPNLPERVARCISTTLNESAEQIQFCSMDEFELFARVVEAEAGNQGLYGKQLVADVILNRVDSDRFPDDLETVLTQSGQFTVVGSGAIWRVNPTDETYQAIFMELGDREDYQILFFCAGGYNATPAYQYKDHYFGY